MGKSDSIEVIGLPIISNLIENVVFNIGVTGRSPYKVYATYSIRMGVRNYDLWGWAT